jgi:hypothetical protein
MKNIGTADRVIRLVVGLIALLLAFLVSMNGALQIILWVVGAILVVTAAIGVCPLYMLLHWSTKSKKT